MYMEAMGVRILEMEGHNHQANIVILRVGLYTGIGVQGHFQTIG